MSKIIFFQAHPDDLEFSCAQIMHHFSMNSTKKHIINVVSMTKGEFGLPANYDKYKGAPLSRVRTRELIKALSYHKIPPENIEFLGYIDGYVEFNKETIQTVKKYLEKEKPDIIFGPEPMYTLYQHPDHVNTGKVLFYIIYNKLLGYIPKLFYFTALNPNFFFPFQKENVKLAKDLLDIHQSQWWLTKYLKYVYWPISRFSGIKKRGWIFKGYRYTEPFRQVYFSNISKNKPPLFTRIFTHFFKSHSQWFQANYPQDILEELKKKGQYAKYT